MNKNISLNYYYDYEILMSILSEERLNVELFKIYRDYEGLKKYKTCVICENIGKPSGKIIRAHSISKNKVLKNISNEKNGKCIVGKFKKTNIKNPNPLEQKIDVVYELINSASTFTGLCKYHDNKLFKDIDGYPYEIESYKNIFQYTLRNCIYQYYDRTSNLIGASLRNKIMSSSTYNNLFDISILVERISNQLNIIKEDLKKLIGYIIDKDIENKLLYKVFEFNRNINIAGNVRFTNENDIFYFTFIPGKPKSYVLLSCLRKENIMEMNYLFNIISSLDIHDFELFLSDLLLSSTSIRHYYFNYNKFNDFSVDKQEIIKDWLDCENLESPLRLNYRYDILGDVPSFFNRISS